MEDIPRFTFLKIEELRIRVWLSKQCHEEDTMWKNLRPKCFLHVPPWKRTYLRNQEVAAFPKPWCLQAQGRAAGNISSSEAKQGKWDKGRLFLLQTVLWGPLLAGDIDILWSGHLRSQDCFLYEISFELGPKGVDGREGREEDQEVEDPQMRKRPLTLFGGGDICLHHTPQMEFHTQSFVYWLCSTAKLPHPK